ncbi:Hypothetical predicted protein [Mytilus galloprovincialis]|uniref:Uncharacterized protein n=1 Tax=Mytilus galloprovincialis TaxID=29158 RepID=A0A8B6FDA1_MYTGA|nr:Hypothetical predicted protein [Mytilus galloprovincialis]
MEQRNRTNEQLVARNLAMEKHCDKQMERYITDITAYQGTVMELKKGKDISEKRIIELEDQIRYIKQSYESIKNQQILEREKKFRESVLPLDNDNQNCFEERNGNVDLYSCTSLDFVKNILFKQTEKEIQHEEQLTAAKMKEDAMTKDIDLLYISLDKERKEFEEIKTRLEAADKRELKLVTKIQMLETSTEEKRRIFDEKEKTMKETIQQKDKEIRKLQRLLKGQQQIMFEIKQMSKKSFMNVRKRSTIDDVETYKKQLADAQSKHQIVEERGNFQPQKDFIGHSERYEMFKMDEEQPGEYSNNTSTTDTVSDNAIDNYSEESLSPVWDDRRKESVQTRKNSQTIITPKRVNIYNYAAVNAEEPV